VSGLLEDGEEGLQGREEGFPLFPLGIVALPSETVPLHIFEDRYLRMVHKCLEHEHEFGIVWLSDLELHEVGCACAIDHVVEEGEDGTLDIVARGIRPLRVIERQDTLPYPAGIVEPLIDSDEPEDSEAAQVARELYGELVEQATDRQLSERELAELDAYTMAGTVDFGPEAKQELLELRSENERMGMLAVLFRAAIERLELVDRAQARARSNGKVRFS
jgi:Lon protease-like protein